MSSPKCVRFILFGHWAIYALIMLYFYFFKAVHWAMHCLNQYANRCFGIFSNIALLHMHAHFYMMHTDMAGCSCKNKDRMSKTHYFDTYGFEMALWCVAWKLIAAAMREKTKATGIYYPTVQSSAILICWRWWWLLCSIWRQVLHVILDLFFARFIFDWTNSKDHLFKKRPPFTANYRFAHFQCHTSLKRIAIKNDNARSNRLGNGEMKHWALEFVFKSHLHILWLHGNLLSLPFKGNIHRG